jgi:hypothetical protein
MAAILKMVADKSAKCQCSLIGNDENCIQGHFYDVTVSKMAGNKIDKLLMISDFNETLYLGVF